MKRDRELSRKERRKEQGREGGREGEEREKIVLRWRRELRRNTD